MTDPHTVARDTYQAEIAENPLYPDGAPRPTWENLRPRARDHRVRIAQREIAE